MIQVRVYRWAGCGRCDQVLADLEALQNEFPHQVTITDLSDSVEAQQRFGTDPPVVQIGSITLKNPITFSELRAALITNVVRESQPSPRPAAVWERQTWTKGDAFSLWFTKHYVAVFNTILLIFVGLPFLAPVLMKANLVLPANLIYRGYNLLCHQLAYRSFFLFGEQWVYPRTDAHVNDLLSYGQATGLGESNAPDEFLAAREYIGNPAMGYKVALCERDVAIYLSLLLFGLIFSVTRKYWPPLRWYIWVAVGILPVALDGGSQLISQLGFPFIPYRESTPFLRILTGGLFGWMTAWFGYPTIEQSMADTVEFIQSKRQRFTRLK